VAIFTIELGPNKLDGVDHMHLNEAGFIDSMTVARRPLPAVVEVQKRLAPAFGMTPLTLVPVTQAAEIVQRASALQNLSVPRRIRIQKGRK
jgi:hypothetical protein